MRARMGNFRYFKDGDKYQCCPCFLPGIPQDKNILPRLIKVRRTLSIMKGATVFSSSSFLDICKKDIMKARLFNAFTGITWKPLTYTGSASDLFLFPT